MPQQFVKDPDAVLDYSIDWSEWLDGDTISVSSWTAADGITIAQEPTSTSTVATIWLSGGVSGERYALANRIETVAGRVNDLTIYVTAQEQ